MKCKLIINKPRSEQGDRVTNVITEDGIKLNPVAIEFDQMLIPGNGNEFEMLLNFFSIDKRQRHEIKILDKIQGEIEFEIPDETYKEFIAHWRILNGFR